MPFYSRPRARPTPFRNVLHAFVQAPGLPFREVFAEELLERVAAEEAMTFGTGPEAIYSVAVIVWAFLTQVASKDQTCRQTVARVLAYLVTSGREPCSARTGAYCKARQKLSQQFLRRLTLSVGEQVEQGAPGGWRWKGRRALLADGTTVTAPDTPANQAVYPQSPSQQPGLGFPIIRLVVLLTLATAVLIGAAMGPYSGKETGETALLRTLLDQVQAGDVLVADRYYCSYWMIALARGRGADVVFRLHQCRAYDFRRGRRLGAGDHVVVWVKPQRPDWMDPETYAAIPETLTLREARTFVDTPGYRAQELVIVTTMTDGDTYTKDDLLDLYHDRWHVELDIEAIKQSLQMDVLRCKTPAMVQKEIWAHLLVYNLVRKVMAQAALTEDINPRTISFRGALQTLQEFRAALVQAPAEALAPLAEVLLAAIATHRVGDRPDRCEPRAVKRRPKEYDRLTKPRAEARAQLLHR